MSPEPKLLAFRSLGHNSRSPGEERGIWQGARPAAWHPKLAASSWGWGRGVSRGTRCGENCWRVSRLSSEVQGPAERPEGTPGSLELTTPPLLQGEEDTYFVAWLAGSPLPGGGRAERVDGTVWRHLHGAWGREGHSLGCAARWPFKPWPGPPTSPLTFPPQLLSLPRIPVPSLHAALLPPSGKLS